MIEKSLTPLMTLGSWMLAQASPTAATGIPFVDDLARLGATGVALGVLMFMVIRREAQLELMNKAYREDIQGITKQLSETTDKHTDALNKLTEEIKGLAVADKLINKMGKHD